MAVYLDGDQWRYRIVVRFNGGSKRLSGTPLENSFAAARLAEDQHVKQMIAIPSIALSRAGAAELTVSTDASIYLLHPVDRNTLSTNQKGAASEARVISHLIQAGYGVSVATGSLRYDLVIETPSGELKKVQVKTGRIKHDWLRFSPNSVVPKTADSPAKHRKYTVDEVDLFAVYSPDLDTSYLIPNTGNTPGSLHLTKTRGEAAIERRTHKKKNSAVAQGIERPLPKGRDGGSSPSGATERSESLEDATDSAQSSCVTSTLPVV